MHDKNTIHELISEFYSYAKENMGFDKPCKVFLRENAENAADPLGKSAYYDPKDGSPPVCHWQTSKDILRSFSHELMHHTELSRSFRQYRCNDQGCSGKPRSRKPELEAYRSNISEIGQIPEKIKEFRLTEATEQVSSARYLKITKRAGPSGDRSKLQKRNQINMKKLLQQRNERLFNKLFENQGTEPRIGCCSDRGGYRRGRRTRRRGDFEEVMLTDLTNLKRTKKKQLQKKSPKKSKKTTYRLHSNHKNKNERW